MSVSRMPAPWHPCPARHSAASRPTESSRTPALPALSIATISNWRIAGHPASRGPAAAPTISRRRKVLDILRSRSSIERFSEKETISRNWIMTHKRASGTIPALRWISISVLILALAGCSIKQLAVDSLGNALSNV